MRERKIPRTVGITPRQDVALTKEASRLGISDGELFRRVIDWWIEATTPMPKTGDLARKLYSEPR